MSSRAATTVVVLLEGASDVGPRSIIYTLQGLNHADLGWLESSSDFATVLVSPEPVARLQQP